MSVLTPGHLAGAVDDLDGATERMSPPGGGSGLRPARTRSDLESSRRCNSLDPVNHRRRPQASSGGRDDAC